MNNEQTQPTRQELVRYKCVEVGCIFEEDLHPMTQWCPICTSVLGYPAYLVRKL